MRKFFTNRPLLSAHCLLLRITVAAPYVHYRASLKISHMYNISHMYSTLAYLIPISHNYKTTDSTSLSVVFDKFSKMILFT